MSIIIVSVIMLCIIFLGYKIRRNKTEIKPQNRLICNDQIIKNDTTTILIFTLFILTILIKYG
jgi:hypothetical protein